jgi:putative ABC transport system ATP-binding protein
VPVDKAQTLFRVVAKIPMFSGLTADSVKKVLMACESRVAEPGQVLCRFGEPSHEMLILLSGRLDVFTDTRVHLASVTPVAPVGEMGLITGQPRSATVVVAERVNLLAIKKTAFDRLNRQGGEICAQVYRNVIQTLSHRLRATRSQAHASGAELAELEARLARAKEEIESIRGAQVASR